MKNFDKSLIIIMFINIFSIEGKIAYEPRRTEIGSKEIAVLKKTFYKKYFKTRQRVA